MAASPYACVVFPSPYHTIPIPMLQKHGPIVQTYHGRNVTLVQFAHSSSAQDCRFHHPKCFASIPNRTLYFQEVAYNKHELSELHKLFLGHQLQILDIRPNPNGGTMVKYANVPLAVMAHRLLNHKRPIWARHTNPDVYRIPGQPAERHKKTLYISNIQLHSRQQLLGRFCRYGPIVRVHFSPPRAFIQYWSYESAQEAIEGEHEALFGNFRPRVEYAREREREPKCHNAENRPSGDKPPSSTMAQAEAPVSHC